jgi:hypothetical protein
VVVSRRSHEQDLRPRFLYREEPMSATDSGWSALVGDETRDELDDPDSMISRPLELLIESWPELRPVFETDEPESQWEWDDGRQEYVVRLPPPDC